MRAAKSKSPSSGPLPELDIAQIRTRMPNDGDIYATDSAVFCHVGSRIWCGAIVAYEFQKGAWQKAEPQEFDPRIKTTFDVFGAKTA